MTLLAPLTMIITMGPSAGCNLLMSLSKKTRDTANTLSKRNVDFDRPAPAERDLKDIQTVAIGELEGSKAHAAMVRGYLSTYLNDSGRFKLIQLESLQAEVSGATAGGAATAQAGAEGEGAEAAAAGPATGVAKIEGSIVQAAYTERIDTSKSSCGDNKTCTTQTRIGSAVVTIDVALVDVVSGELLVHKTLEDRREKSTKAVDDKPPSIDGNALLDVAAKKVAGDFFAAVSPHLVSETVFFETDNAAKSLKEGANRALSGDLEGAIEAFEQGLAEAKGKKDDTAIAKAQFDLGLALVIKGEYDAGIALIQAAQELKAKKAWGDVLLAARGWKTDTEQSMSQWEAHDGGTPPLDPALRESESATAMGTKTVKAAYTVARVGIGL